MIWRTLLVILVWCGFLSGVHAQYTSDLNRFQVDQVKGCAPFTVNVTIVAPFVCDGANPCDMDFEGNGVFQSLTFTHTYTVPGTYRLRILFQTSGFDEIDIEVLPNILPQFEVYTCGNNEVSVRLNDDNYDEYVINYNDGSPETVVSGTATDRHVYASSAPQTVTVRGRDLGAADNCSENGVIVTPLLTLPAPTITLLEVLDDQSIRIAFNGSPNIQYRLGIATNNATTFQQAKTLYNTTVDTIFNLRTEENYYCFQLAAYDPCNNTVVASTPVCSADLDLSVRNNAIDVAWSTAAVGITGYRLTRVAADGTFLVTAPAGSPYADLGVTCGMEYCYQLTANYAGGASSVSLTKCAVGFSTDIPTAIENITVRAGDNSALLEWQTDPAFTAAEFSIERSVNGGDYIFLSATSQNAYADEEYNAADRYCYRIRYTDVCGNESPASLEACALKLTADLLDDNSISLTWTPYQGWTQGASGYVVEKYTEDGLLLQTFQAGNNTSYIDQSDDFDYQTFVYVVKAIPVENGIGQAQSNAVAILKDPNLFHPTAFTPNGDNLNDNFTVFGQYVVNFEMKIFNRWGELLFTTDNLAAGWDGTFRGNEMPEGTYTFIAHITDRAGRTFKRSGSVLLLRKR